MTASIAALLHAPFLGHESWLWMTFLALVALLLAFDLGLLHRTNRAIGVGESILLSAGYVAVALLFGAWLWSRMGAAPAIAYYTGFVIEKSLSIDNVFVIALIFTYFGIPRAYQYRVLFWGILGAIVLRAVLIALGASLIAHFAWVLYLFGAFLVYTGVQMWRHAEHVPDIARHPALRVLRRYLPLTERSEGGAFVVHRAQNGGRVATPLFLALCLVELVDLMFAVDSVPAIFAITQDPFIVYTSNIFAILGLRALYFALAALLERFRHIKYALALVLVFVGVKILAAHVVEVPAVASLAITLGLLAGGVVVSLWKTRRRVASQRRMLGRSPS